jgi:hypothetical protein
MGTQPRWPGRAAVVAAALMALASIVGIAFPAAYRRETASWAAQAVGQDWVNLVLVVPLLVTSAWRTRLGSRGFRLVLGGALLYTVYSYVLYAFAVHFNVLFLVYCAALGTSSFSLAGLAASALRDDPRSWYERPPPARLAGALLVIVAVLFAGLWLAEIVPALAAGSPPASIAEVGSFTNPVHVLDLALLLPAMALTGVSLLRDRPLGHAAGPALLTFNVLMPIAIVAMVVSMRLRGLPASLAPLVAFALLVPAMAVVLALFLRRLRPGPAALREGRRS